MSAPRCPALYQINTRVRLTELSHVLGRPATLDDFGDAELDRWIAAHHGAFYHGVGTCRMGDEATSVTDPSCRVRGVDGLFVVDASTIPRVPRSNTHLVVVALAERAAAKLSGRAA